VSALFARHRHGYEFKRGGKELIGLFLMQQVAGVSHYRKAGIFVRSMIKFGLRLRAPFILAALQYQDILFHLAQARIDSGIVKIME
jgi:hypothetical protein